MRHLKSVLTVLGAATVLVLAGNTIVMAATGNSLLLGKSNSANANTSITRTTSGSVLKLQSKYSSNAPLTVNGKGKVANLNADTVDGVDSASLKMKSYVFTTAVPVATGSFNITIPLPSGTYQLDYSAYLHGADNSSLSYCYLEQDSNLVGTDSVYVGENRFSPGTATPGLSGSGVLTKSSTNSLELTCGASETFTTVSNQPIQVVATKIDTVVKSNIALPRAAAKASVTK